MYMYMHGGLLKDSIIMYMYMYSCGKYFFLSVWKQKNVKILFHENSIVRIISTS